MTLTRRLPGPLALGAPVLQTAYPLNPPFAFYLALRLARSKTVWDRIGAHVQPACMGAATTVLLTLAAGDCAKDLGRAPASTLLVFQRLRSYVDRGSHRMADVEAVLEQVEEFDAMAADAATRGESPPDDEAIIAEVLPLLRQRAQRQALVEGGQLLAAGNFAEMTAVADRIYEVSRLGEAAETADDDGWDDAKATIASVQGLPRCAVGVDELDVILRGGPHLGSYTTWAAATGGAKSTAICHVAATALIQRKNVLLAFLELPKWEGWSKIIANLTGVPLDAIRENAAGGWVALEGMKGRLGDVRMIEMPENRTTAQDIARWRDRAQQKYGVRYEVVCVDGVDHLTSASQPVGGSSYDLGKYVCADLDTFAGGGVDKSDPIWLHVTSHLQRGKKYSALALDGTPLPGKDDLADSKHRANKTHYLITNLVKRDEAGTEMIYFNLAKSRFSRSDVVVGPIPCDMATARIVLPYQPHGNPALPWGVTP